MTAEEGEATLGPTLPCTNPVLALTGNDRYQPSATKPFIATVVDLAVMVAALNALNDPPHKQQQAGVPTERQGKSQNEHRPRPRIGDSFGNRCSV
jgi:hypothetical protein